MNLKSYFLNCFLLLIPIFLWNILLVDYLPEPFNPEFFDRNIPNYISWSENILRFMVFVSPIFMVFNIKTKNHKIGLIIYIVGVLTYFASWLIVIFYPYSDWSLSPIGFTAPAYTTILWFIGIALIGNQSFLKIPRISFVYLVISFVFVVIHTTHAYLAIVNFHLDQS